MARDRAAAAAAESGLQSCHIKHVGRRRAVRLGDDCTRHPGRNDLVQDARGSVCGARSR